MLQTPYAYANGAPYRMRDFNIAERVDCGLLMLIASILNQA